MISAERERETGGGGLHSVFSAEELESSLAAEETQTRYVPYRLVQVGKVIPVIRRRLWRTDPRLNVFLTYSACSGN